MKKTKLYILQVAMFIIIAFVILTAYIMGLNDYKLIATTDDIKKADEIEAIISSPYKEIQTIRITDNSRSIYTIAIKRANKDNYKAAILSLITNDVVTNHVALELDNPPMIFGKIASIQKLEKAYNKKLPFLINGITGVYSSKVNIKLNNSLFNGDYREHHTTTANVTINTDESFDTEKIKKLTEELLCSMVLGLTNDNVNIEFNIKSLAF